MTLFNPTRTPISVLLLGTIAAQAGAQVVRERGLSSSVAVQQRTVPGFYRLLLGKFEITALSDGTVTLPLDPHRGTHPCGMKR